MDLSVVLCTYNRCEMLRSALTDLAHQVAPDDLSWEVVVVDNSSDDDTRAVVEAFVSEHPGLFRYCFEGRLGKSYALNTGIDEAAGDILAFTDDDVQITPAWVAEVAATFERFGCAGVGGRIETVFPDKRPAWLVDPPGKVLATLVHFDHGDEPKRLEVAPFGANMSFRRECFTRYGGFRVDLGPTAENRMGRAEDGDFCWRVLAGGDTIMYAPGALIRHPVEPERMTKRYFLSWWFNSGRSRAIRANFPADAVLWFGVPRYLLPKLAKTLIRLALARNRNTRVEASLNVATAWGLLVESFQRRRTIARDALKARGSAAPSRRAR